MKISGIIACVLFTVALSQQAFAQAAHGSIVRIAAEGLTESSPDMATINLGVTAQGRTAEAAVAENARRMSALLAALRQSGIADSDIQTAYVSVQRQYEGRPRTVQSYMASTSVSARVRDISRVGRVIDAAVAAGGNEVNGVSFSHQNPEQQLNAARANAIAAARARADLYAQTLGTRVKRIVALDELGAGGAARLEDLTNQLPQVFAAQGRVETPVAPGLVDTRVTLNVTFELQ